jgi:hypothetical protein
MIGKVFATAIIAIALLSAFTLQNTVSAKKDSQDTKSGNCRYICWDNCKEKYVTHPISKECRDPPRKDKKAD